MGKSVKSDARQERLAAALRENLKRRKLRARALVDDGPQAPVRGDGPAFDSPSGRRNKVTDRD